MGMKSNQADQCFYFTVQPHVNADGSIYRYNPNEPPPWLVSSNTPQQPPNCSLIYSANVQYQVSLYSCSVLLDVCDAHTQSLYFFSPVFMYVWIDTQELYICYYLLSDRKEMIYKAVFIDMVFRLFLGTNEFQLSSWFLPLPLSPLVLTANHSLTCTVFECRTQQICATASLA